MALDNDHEWMGSSGHSVQDTIDAMRKKDEEFDDAVTRGYEDSGKWKDN